MSGHSKWSTIKHKKAAADAKRGKIFTKLAGQIALAAKSGGGDPEANPALRLLVDKARSVNMPSDNVRRAIDRGLGKGGASAMEEVVYEGYGLGGVGVMVSTLTDNRNRTGSEVRQIFERFGGSISGPGSVAYMKNIQPIPTVSLAGEEDGKVRAMLETLEDLDDVLEVWSNLA